MTAAGRAGTPPASATPNGPVRLDSPHLLPPLGHYSHVAVSNGHAFVSGQLPITPEGTAIVDQPFGAQVRQVLTNIDACLAAAGTDRSQLVFVQVYVANIDDWPAFDGLYAEWAGSIRPARAVTGGQSLHFGALVEISAVAAIGAG